MGLPAHSFVVGQKIFLDFCDWNRPCADRRTKISEVYDSAALEHFKFADGSYLFQCAAAAGVREPGETGEEHEIDFGA